MEKFAFYNNKGGIGKTTFCFNAACYFGEHGLKVVAVCLDPQRDLLRVFKGDDGRLRRDDVITVHSLTAFYSPNQLPDINSDCDILFADCPPDIAISRKVRPTRWFVPVDSRLAGENFDNVAADLRRSAPVTAFINKADTGGKRALEELREAVDSMAGVDVYPETIADSGTIARTVSEFRPVWETRYSRGREGTKQMERFCKHLMRLSGLKPSQRQRWPEWRRKS